ncbi:MAG TPA: hypothetical protein VER11_11045 [Polyangiaceae bacterium]|nr:hypothetical protein [Polyangiaceae bacterium]
MPRFVLSSLSFADTEERCRLHSRSFVVFARVVSLLLLLSVFRLLRSDSIIEASVHALLALALAWLLWTRPKSIFATKHGLAIRSGKKTRLVPWASVLDVRELPWIRFNPPWYPKMWQVDLEGDERFDFCGVRNARQIVIAFVARDQARSRL